MPVSPMAKDARSDMPLGVDLAVDDRHTGVAPARWVLVWNAAGERAVCAAAQLRAGLIRAFARPHVAWWAKGRKCLSHEGCKATF